MKITLGYRYLDNAYLFCLDWIKKCFLFLLFTRIGIKVNWIRFKPRIRLRRIKKFHLISTSDFVEKYGLKPFLYAQAETIQVPGPKFIGDCPNELRVAETVQLHLPPVEIMTVPSATVWGWSNLIFVGDKAVHPDLYIPDRDVTSAEIHRVAFSNPHSKQIQIQFPFKSQSKIQAISLIGQCPWNYAHWITEILPKLLIVDSLSEFDGLPLVIDRMTHPIFKSILETFNLKKREVISVGQWRRAHFQHLIDISPLSYTPPELRVVFEGKGLPQPVPELFYFSRVALSMIRTAADGLLSRYKPIGVKKLYLRRQPESSGNGRLVSNRGLVERYLVGQGFMPIDPAKYDFIEQMALFREAEVIVSPVGAALINTIFTPPGCKIIALSPYFKNANYYYFSNLMGLLGHDLHYLLGSTEVNVEQSIQNDNDYSINLRKLRRALEIVI